MKKSYKALSYIVYTVSLIYISITMYNTGLEKFDLSFSVNNIYYLLMLGVFSSFIFFRFSNYDLYIKKHASFLVIRYGNYSKIYGMFVFNGIIQSLILTLIKVAVDIFVFESTNSIDTVIYFMVMITLILIHINLEVIVNSKFAIIVILGYFATSFSLCDLLIENNMKNLIYWFIPNMLLATRRGSLVICIVILVFLLISNFIIGKSLIERKEIL